MDESSWIADGTPADEPVTTETPVDEAPDTSTPPAIESEAVEAPVAPVETPETAPTPAEVAQAYIEGKLGDEPYQIPENALLPLKRGDEVQYKPVTDLLRGGMRQWDYDQKMREAKERESAFEARQSRIAAEQARIEERVKFLDERESELKEAMTDPQKWAAYQDHLTQYQANPIYRKNVDAALAQRETEAELNTYRAQEESRIKDQAISTVHSWISELAEQHPGVDPNRIARVYGAELSNGQASLERSHVERLFKSEAAYLTESMTPLQSELAALKATVEALTASQAAEQHNAQTAHAVNRAKAPRVATGQSAPAKTPVPPSKFGPNELQERNSAWVKAG